jgi:16S rRNA (guanine527-N7)-methyltransferase
MISMDEAVGRPVSRETFELLEAYAGLVRAGNATQNLISASTVDGLWERHIVDSAQLVRFESRPSASWIDIGSGAGLPGIVLAALTDGPVTLVEPRRLRADFLARTVAELGLDLRVSVHTTKIEKMPGSFDVITARAVAPLTRLLGMAHHLSHEGTVWILPKGKNAKSELAEAQRSWQCEARIEASCTDPDARILVLRHVKAKSNR